MKKAQGNIANLLATGLCVLAMTVVVMGYMDSVRLIHGKWEIVQLARKYILRMETCGYLSREDEGRLLHELEQLGVAEVDLSGSTINQVDYGEEIVLQIKGRLGEEHVFDEKRTSTAKH